MIAVIFAGGAGTRLWPLSTPTYPKHLLKINGSQKSLLQHTYARASKLADTVYITSDSSHGHHVKDQLPELTDDTLILEPDRRGTASCVVAALARIAENHDKDEPIVFMHADHYIRDVDGFVHSFTVAGEASRKSGRITLVGIEPDYPATGFGYIQKDGLFDEEHFVFKVDCFVEKPNFEKAKEYMNSGNYLWNCGYFVGSLNTFEKSMKAHAPVMYKEYKELLDTKTSEEFNATYLGFEDISIDYALMEPSPDLLVVPASFDWMDIGSYGDLHKAVDNDERGNHVHGNKVELEEVENSFVQNHEEKPVAVIGLDNIVVINSPNGILVARKDLAQKIGEVSKRISKK